MTTTQASFSSRTHSLRPSAMGVVSKQPISANSPPSLAKAGARACDVTLNGTKRRPRHDYGWATSGAIRRIAAPGTPSTQGDWQRRRLSCDSR